MAPNPTLPNLTNRITHNQLSSAKGKSIKDLKNKKCDILNCEVLCENLSELADSLDELDLSNEDFDKLSSILNLIKNLKKLNIQNTVIKILPKEIANLKCLNTLTLSQNQIDELPDSLSDLKYLESLDVSYNALKSLPLAYARLQRLKYLNLCGNKFKSVPECIANGMGTLKVLNISENISAKVNVIPCSKFLEKLFANNNKRCCMFPDWIFSPKFLNLKELELNKTEFDVYNFTSSRRVLCIKKLSMSCSNLSSPVLEMMIEYMNSLEVINIGNEKLHEKGNLFNRIPIQTFQHPERITEINFRGTNLSSISESIKQLCNLKKLDIGINCISWFPSELCELEGLESLKIDGNGVIMLPENIGNMKSLEELRAEHNALMRLPNSFRSLKNLKLLDLYDNIFEDIPDVLFEMENLESLDLEQNFVNTSEIKLKDIPYLTLRQNCMTVLMENDKNILLYRFAGTKQQTPVESNESSLGSPQWPSDDEVSENLPGNLRSEADENWDSVVDTDDEYDPEVVATAVNHNVNSRKYSHVYGLANKFCPADLHTTNVKKEVASMIAFGSLPSFKEEEGQFDDA